MLIAVASGCVPATGDACRGGWVTCAASGRSVPPALGERIAVRLVLDEQGEQ